MGDAIVVLAWSSGFGLQIKLGFFRLIASTPRQSLFRLSLALRIGLAGGLAFCGLGLLFLTLIGLRFGSSEAVRATDQYKLTFFIAQVGIAALMQADVATIVLNRVQRLGVLHGLSAAFIAGCVMALGLLGLSLLFGGTITPQFAWNTFNQVVNEGMLLALPIAWSVSMLTGLVRRAEDSLMQQRTAKP